MFKLGKVAYLNRSLLRGQWSRRARVCFRVVLVLAGLWLALATAAWSTQTAESLRTIEPFDHFVSVSQATISDAAAMPEARTQTFAGRTASVQPAGVRRDIALGIDAFEQGRLKAAIAAWQAALASVEAEAYSDPERDLTKAYLQSSIAAAYQQMGELSAAQAAVAESLDIVTAWPVESPTYWEVSARVFNTQAQILYREGQTEQALARWQQAELHYRMAQQPAGEMRSQINQAIALQTLGFNVRAVQQLTALSEDLWRDADGRSYSDSSQLNLQLAAATELGSALRLVGELHRAQSILLHSLQLVEEAAGYSTNDAAVGEIATDEIATDEIEPGEVTTEQLRLGLKLELAHTRRALSHRAIVIGKREAARDYSEQAIADYSTVWTQASELQMPLRVQAQINQFMHLIETAQLAEANAFWPQLDLSTLASGRERTEAYISYAHSLNCLRSPLSVTCVQKGWQPTLSESSSDSAVPDWRLIADTLAEAIRQAEALSDPLLSSYAIGELGHTYELAGQVDEAIQLTQQALRELEGKQIPEAAYRWEWQLGRLYRSEGAASDRAAASYQQALASLDVVRQNLLLIDPQAQFSFRDDVEPLYREFVTLLLEQRSAGESAPDNEALALAVETLDALQLTELENFLGCNLAQLVNLTEENATEATDPTAAKIYPILLPNQLAVIVDMPNQPLLLRTTSVSQPQVEETLRLLRNNLTLPGKTPAVLVSAQQLYQWLIAPIEPILAENEQIETMVFVLDGPLRNVPIGVLYDGQQYLIEKQYAIAIAPQLALFAPRAMPAPLRVLRGGVSLPQTVRGRRFSAIELVRAELEKIPSELTVASPLIDEAFTQANIERQLANERYNAIHWKTHGVFSADPAETFLVAYREGINANELSDLVRSARAQQAAPLELLVLSACETAQGDRRAVLGLAGIAVRAGTRSTLSTLWRADDGANTQLMNDFYQGLQQGLTKAQSLQRSQQRLISEAGYPAPYYWAPYVLVGNWL